uniref:Phospholipase A-2-activating protein n=1 Tax=Timema cristinae TaxID=61476 RepID=A0A7R9CX72_TIMCR|nr:unnamed protein product [Timema cristinae]
MAGVPYKLSCVLYGHKSDVRAVAATRNGCIVSGSRDKSAKLWTPNSTNAGFSESQTLLGHTNFVSSVCVLQPHGSHKLGLIITGGNDRNIGVFTPESPTPLCVLKGHGSTVCGLSPGIEEGTFLSASWDLTAKLWKAHGNDSPLMSLSGHEAAVWAVIQLATTKTIVTGSADKNIKTWTSTGEPLRTLKGHSDCVRGLVATSDKEFLSCANDATVMYWNAESGTCLATLYGHTNYIYSIAMIEGESFVTSGEDRTLRVWRLADCVQTIHLPCQSVWSVAVLPNKDIIAGTSDGLVRVFSADPSRCASPEILAKFEEEVANINTVAEKEIGGVKISDLPGKEVLVKPGRSDGQTKLVKEGGAAVCYSWSAASQEWTKVGDVLGATSGEKQLYAGKEYDYVFSVDVEDGKPPLKLPYNKNEDPWVAAQRFIHDNHLSQLYLDQVANFIVTNSNKTDASPLPQFSDPFTVHSTEIRTSISPSSAVELNMTSALANYATEAESGKERCPSKPYFPQKIYLRFDQANLKVILEKLHELNCSPGDRVNQVSEDQLEGLVKMADPTSSIQPSHVDVLKQLLEWPSEIVYPVLDIARLAVRNQEVNTAICSGQIGDQLIGYLRRFLLPTSPKANQMLSLRLVCNMFAHQDGVNLVLKHRDYLLSTLVDLVPPCHKNVQIAAATLILNLAVAFNRIPNPLGQIQTVSTASTVLPRLTDPEAQFRTLVALGTLLWDMDQPDSRAKLVHCVKNTPALPTLLEQWACSSSIEQQHAKVANCSAQVVALLDM